MPHPAAFQLESLSYQNDAVESVVRVFGGTPKPAAADLAGNRCPLRWAQISANLQAIAQRNRISDERLNLNAPAQGLALDVCVEMETGTGKTLVYLRTIYRLQAAYGWNKFIIVVPTVAIRAGVMGSLTDFGAQLAEQNGLTHSIPAFEYDSSRLQQLKTFIDSPTPAIMVMNSQAFVGQGKIINNEENEAPLDGLTWLQALARCRPVVVMDEPQMGMDTDAAVKAFDDMKPLAKLRYSATHSKGQARNCVYRLTPAQAYEQGLVKKIEVLTIDEQGGAGTVQLQLADTQARAGQQPKAKLKLWHRAANGEIKQKISSWLSRGADLAEVTANRSYVGWRIDHIEKSLETSQWQVRFDNGHTLVQGQALGQDQEGIFRLQLRWLIHRHFEKKARLAPLGIKCLSLVFIDKVANYLTNVPGETPRIKRLFEEEYSTKLQTLTGQAPDALQVQAVQGSYFAQTGQGAYTDSETTMSKNSGIYKRILTDKAGLLQLSDPVEFIFSHSALGVGWDNPNVFNIATLNATQNHDKKRQELGRGLRICVNQKGQRVYDTPGIELGKEINLLTVVPNMSYEAFAQGYQAEIKEAYDGEAQAGATLRENRAGKAQKKILKRRQDLFDSNAFKQFWATMARTTRYCVSFDEDAIVQDVVPKLQKISVSSYSADITATRIGILEDTLGHAGFNSTCSSRPLQRSRPTSSTVPLTNKLHTAKPSFASTTNSTPPRSNGSANKKANASSSSRPRWTPRANGICITDWVMGWLCFEFKMHAPEMTQLPSRFSRLIASMHRAALTALAAAPNGQLQKQALMQAIDINVTLDDWARTVYDNGNTRWRSIFAFASVGLSKGGYVTK